MYSVSETIARVLTPRVDTYFGIMGNGNAWFVDALERLGHGIITVRHEVATVAAADAYHRVTGELAVATTTYGPGFTNTITALVEAVKARVPLLLVTGGRPVGNPRPWDIDQAALAASFGVETFTVTPGDVATTTLQALAQASSQRMPVILEIPYDLAATEVTEANVGALLADVSPVPGPNLPRPATGQVRSLAKLLAAADDPLIVAGRGAKTAGADVVELADLLHADVATTAPAQGLFNMPGNFRDLGICGGFAAAGAAEEIRRADVVLVLGASLNQFTMAFGEAFGKAATVIQVDVVEQPTHRRVDHLITGDVASTVIDLLTQLREADYVAGPRDHQGIDPTARPAGDDLAPDGRLDPRSLMGRVNEILPRERVVATDGGHFIGWANTYLDVPAPDHMVLLGTATQSIGLGFQTAVGVAAATGETKTAVLVTGDGGGMMAVADADSFIRQAHRGVVVVINDAAYGAEIHQYGTKGLAEAPMLIPEVDFAGMLGALGARSRIIRELADLADFEQWVAGGESGTYVLDCRVSRNIIAPYMQEMIGG